MEALTSILAPLALLTSLTFMACGSESGAPAPQTAIPEAQPDPCKGAVVVTADSLGNILNAEVRTILCIISLTSDYLHSLTSDFCYCMKI